MRIKEVYLRDGGRSHEAGFLVELRTDLHAATTGDAVRKRIGLFLLLHGHTRTRPEVIGAIDRNPGLDRLQIFEKYTAVHRQVTNDRKFGEWLQLDRLFQIVDQRRTRHTRT